MFEVLNGTRPPRPGNIGDYLWHVIQKCWVVEPFKRPSMREVSWKLRLSQDVPNYLRPQGAGGNSPTSSRKPMITLPPHPPPHPWIHNADDWDTEYQPVFLTDEIPTPEPPILDPLGKDLDPRGLFY